MGRRLTSPDGDIVITVQPINLGGTDAITSGIALGNLDGMSKALIGSPEGVIPLNENSVIPSEFLYPTEDLTTTLDGGLSLYINQIENYIITNFDHNTLYEVTPISGSVVLNHDTITYTAPGTQGSGGFNINGRQFVISIIPGNIQQPVVVSPMNNATTINSSLLITTSAFAINGEQLPHIKSDWQISTDTNFTNVIQQSLNDEVNKTTWSVDGLIANTNYYIRVRYYSEHGIESSWSPVSIFKTKTTFVGINEQAKLVAANGKAGDYFGYAVDISADGNTVVIGASYADSTASNAGNAYVFQRTNGVWSQQAMLYLPTLIANDYFGTAVSVSADGTLIAVGATGADLKGSSSGVVFIFTLIDSTWVKTATVVGNESVANDLFGASVNLSGDGSTLIVGAYQYDSGGITNTGAAYVFTRLGLIWTQRSKLVAPDPATLDFFGNSVTSSYDGSTVVITASYVDVGGVGDTGAAYVFIKTEQETWVQQAKLVASDKASGDQFGISSSLTWDGNTLVIGAYRDDVSGKADAGSAYVFTRSGTTWTQAFRLYAADVLANTLFGYSVSISGDGSTIVVGAYKADITGKSDIGAVYVFVKTDTGWSQHAKILPSDGITKDTFGQSVSVSSNGSTFVVGSYWADPKGAESGAAYVYA